ncbi:MAG: 2,3,4,5-tetrahydropyridine-2,6-dicarboxylate N-succinyltransferase [Arsenophonus sp.]|nr:MAG: 2,3,4,5-tetrahydropyridine-2,6-dicarboxylate N-succinyltransferase [Arsenophonus sp.]
MKILKKIIEEAYKKIEKKLDIDNIEIVLYAINKIILKLNEGKLRVSEKKLGKWKTHQWIKKALLIFFAIKKNKLIKSTKINYFDKIKMKFSNYNSQKFEKDKIRVVFPANIREGAYIAKNTVLMPCFINIGAYIDEGTMIDTWTTVGSCAQIGKNVHLSGGVGIGGVLEPLQDSPTIIEDNCFIGARSEIVEGVVIEEGSVISMGVYIGKSTKIYNVKTNQISYGRIPAGSVVLPGSLPESNGKYNVYSAIIIKNVDERTKSKIKLNKMLRI